MITFTCISYVANTVPVDRIHDLEHKFGSLEGGVIDFYPKKFSDQLSNQSGTILVAILCGFCSAVQVFLEGNISAVLANRPENKLTKGKSYHYDYFIVGVINAVQGVFSLPLAIPSLPHSGIHAIISRKVVEYEEDYVAKMHVVKASEIGRFTNMCASLLRLLSLYIFRRAMYRELPVATISGFLLFMGITSFEENDIWKPVKLIFTQREKIDHRAEESFRFVRLGVINVCTLVQVLCFAIVFTASRSTNFDKNKALPIAALYPLVLVSLIPVSMYILPLFFSEKDLRVLMKENRNVFSPLFC